MSNCPKCNEKLSPFYLKQNCPHCGANLMYYDFENRLQQDAEKVARESENFARIVSGIKRSSIGSAAAIIRLVSFFLPVVALLLPIFKMDFGNVTVITILKSAMGGTDGFVWYAATILCLVDFAAVIVCSLASLIASLFSFAKNGLKRNVIVSALGIILFAGLYIAVIASDAEVNIAYGFFLIPILQIITVALHFAVNNKINEQ